MKVFLIDTNVLLRFFIDTASPQYLRARLIVRSVEKEKAICLLSIMVVGEFIWTSEKYYGLPRAEYCEGLIRFCMLKNVKLVEIQKKDIIHLLDQYSHGKMDLTDLYLHFLSQKEKVSVASFDQDLRKLGCKIIQK